ncbi:MULTISPECIES: hypothetical protein [unclassified Microcoleus]|uniref:hypothetical protein n=1 Tax=unclassified Microcoleus TaxID=2642155 RepID=UPI002FCF347F
MPVEDGYSLIRKVRSSASDKIKRLPAVALTAYASEEDRDRAIAAGYNSHLAPFSLNRQDACSTRKFTLCGTGILPVPRQVIENGARCELQRTLNKADRTRSLRHRFSQVNKFALGRSARYCKL